MTDSTNWNLESYLNFRSEQAEEGRWTDLVEGKIVHRAQPSEGQGHIIFNLTRQLGLYFQQPIPEVSGYAEASGYACFELGLILSREPDTLRFPPISVYQSENRFAHLDDQTTDELPQLVVEHFPTNGSASTLSKLYLQTGIKQVWILNEPEQRAEIHQAGKAPRLINAEESLSAPELWPGFKISLTDLFQIPDW